MKASGRNSKSIFSNRTGLCFYAALFDICDRRVLKWMKNYYIGDGVKNPTRVRARITAGKCVPDIYIVTLSDNPGNILEILPAVTLVQRGARAICPLIIGMAKGKDEAIQMVRDVVEQVYKETGDFKIKEYLKNR